SQEKYSTGFLATQVKKFAFLLQHCLSIFICILENVSPSVSFVDTPESRQKNSNDEPDGKKPALDPISDQDRDRTHSAASSNGEKSYLPEVDQDSDKNQVSAAEARLNWIKAVRTVSLQRASLTSASAPDIEEETQRQKVKEILENANRREVANGNESDLSKVRYKSPW
ncbi:MAG: hypothetical protein GY786_17850, partial [Proteobacteria bacterium]|nr:hypothetical protein [Pseudomonadota bacterium]